MRASILGPSRRKLALSICLDCLPARKLPQHALQLDFRLFSGEVELSQFVLGDTLKW